MTVETPTPRATQEGDERAQRAAWTQRKTFIRKDDQPGSDLALLDQFREAIAANLTDPADFGSLIVRPGVTFLGYEVMMRDRLISVPIESLPGNINAISLEVYAHGIVERLTDRIYCAAYDEPPSWRVIDVERERAHELEEILRVLLGAEETDRFLEQTLAAVDKALGGSKVSPERGLSTARVRMLRLETKRFITEELGARLVQKKQAKSKKENE